MDDKRKSLVEENGPKPYLPVNERDQFLNHAIQIKDQQQYQTSYSSFGAQKNPYENIQHQLY